MVKDPLFLSDEMRDVLCRSVQSCQGFIAYDTATCEQRAAVEHLDAMGCLRICDQYHSDDLRGTVYLLKFLKKGHLLWHEYWSTNLMESEMKRDARFFVRAMRDYLNAGE